jgi:adiponectin receptor
MWRISFFLALGFTTLAPLTTLIYLHGTEQMFQFMSESSEPTPLHCFRRFYVSPHYLADPVGPSIVSYLLGLGFYATQIPERFVVDKKLAHWLDSIGVGSHAIWHVFIVLGMSQYKAAIERMRNGIGCEFS